MYEAEFLEQITDDWRGLRIMRAGRGAPATAPFREPDWVPGDDYPREAAIGIRSGGVPLMRVDIFSYEECATFRDVRALGNLVAVGFGEYLYLIELPHGSIRLLKMRGSFDNLYVAADFDPDLEPFGFLVTSDFDAMRLSPTGEVVWRTKTLAYDGVIIHEVLDGVIRGSGEWDPPDGWEAFEVDLATGTTLLDPEIAADEKFANMRFVTVDPAEYFKSKPREE